MKSSKKSEFFAGVYEGMVMSFFRCTYLNNEENVKVRNLIRSIAENVAASNWNEYKTRISSLEDAKLVGCQVGEDGWESDDQMNSIIAEASK